ncbi:hypothetical protein ACFQV4_31275 [Streptomyces thermocarboxydus]
MHPAGGWREARVLGTTTVTYTATDRTHHVPGALELAVGTAGRDALRLGGGAPAAPCSTRDRHRRRRPRHRAAHRRLRRRLRRPLRPTVPALAALLMENAATVPAYGTDLNLAGVVGLTAASAARRARGRSWSRSNGPLSAPSCTPSSAATRPSWALSARPAVAAVPNSPPSPPAATTASPRCGCAGPTCARTTPPRRRRPPRPGPGRRRRDRLAAVPAAGPRRPRARASRRARPGGRTPLLLLLDDPEQMAPGLYRRLAAWTEETVRRLRATGTRLVVSCTPEHWEEAGHPPALLHHGSACPENLRPVWSSATSPPTRPATPAPATASPRAPSPTPTRPTR